MSNLPLFRLQRCVRYRFRYSQCTRCVDGCPAEALTGTDAGVELDETRCTGCGLCVSNCSVEAIQLPDFPWAALTRPEADAVSVGCFPAGHEADLRVPCLGDIDPAYLASLALRTIPVTLHGAGHCPECAHSPAGMERVALLEGSLERLGEQALQGWQAPVFDRGVTESDHQPGRRRLFSRWANRAVAIAREEDEPEQVPEHAIRAASHYVPLRRKYAERLLPRFEGVAQDAELLEQLDVARIEPGEGGCTGCEACVRVCPTGALRTTAEIQWLLRFDSAQCVGCGVCLEACSVDALALRRQWRAAEEGGAVLHALEQHRCDECGRFFVGGEPGQCPVCDDDQDVFEAIFG